MSSSEADIEHLVWKIYLCLLRAGCPTVKEGESKDVVASLMFEASSHREDLLNWILEVVVGGQSEPQLGMESFIPSWSSFLTAKQPRADQLKNWKLLMRLLESSRRNLTDDDFLEWYGWAKDYQNYLFENGLAAPIATSRRSFTLLPRNLETEICTKESPHQPEIKAILSKVNSELEVLKRRAREGEAKDKPTGDGNTMLLESVSEGMSRLKDDACKFGTAYEEELKVWVDRPPRLETDDHRLRSTVQKFHELITSFKANTDDQNAIKESITSIQTKLQQAEM